MSIIIRAQFPATNCTKFHERVRKIPRCTVAKLFNSTAHHGYVFVSKLSSIRGWWSGVVESCFV